MIYLSHFEFPNREQEYDFSFRQVKTCYDTYYPFGILSRHDFRMLDFEPITILYGGNGSGKTTALCSYEEEEPVPEGSRIITSDDVFDFMFNLRSINDGIDVQRNQLFEEYQKARSFSFRMQSLADYEQLKKVTSARSKTQSKYVRANLQDNVREHSNGESAFLYFCEKIGESGLYLLDEPENSLSPDRQQELLGVLEDAVRYFNCQLIISTHSPFLLSARGAKIYDLDEEVVDVKRWTELSSVRTYYEFFRKHESEFE